MKENMIIRIEPCKQINSIPFGANRETVRKMLNMEYQEFRKSVYATNTTDAYDSFHVFYDDDDNFEAIEIFEGTVIIRNERVFPGKLDGILRLFPEMVYDGFGYISTENSIGITTSAEDSDSIEAILFGRSNYYSDIE